MAQNKFLVTIRKLFVFITPSGPQHAVTVCVKCHWYYLLTYLLTYLLHGAEKLAGSQLVNKLPALYRNRVFITAFTRSRHPSLSWAGLIQTMPPHPTTWRSILILSSHLRLCLPSSVFPQVSPPKPCIHLSSVCNIIFRLHSFHAQVCVSKLTYTFRRRSYSSLH